MQKKEEEPVMSKKEGGDEKENVGEELAWAKKVRSAATKDAFSFLTPL